MRGSGFRSEEALLSGKWLLFLFEGLSYDLVVVLDFYDSAVF